MFGCLSRPAHAGPEPRGRAQRNISAYPVSVYVLQSLTTPAPTTTTPRVARATTMCALRNRGMECSPRRKSSEVNPHVVPHCPRSAFVPSLVTTCLFRMLLGVILSCKPRGSARNSIVATTGTALNLYFVHLARKSVVLLCTNSSDLVHTRLRSYHGPFVWPARKEVSQIPARQTLGTECRACLLDRSYNLWTVVFVSVRVEKVYGEKDCVTFARSSTIGATGRL